MGKRINVTDEQITQVAESSISALEASSKLGIKYDTYRKHATRLGVFKTNQSGKGISKNRPSIPLSDILEGNQPQYNVNRLKNRLIETGLKKHECESCGLSEWMDNPIPIELDHINGQCYDHRLENLRVLCPNCHAMTDTYRGKNTKLTA